MIEADVAPQPGHHPGSHERTHGMVQLLGPDGVRREHPDYDVALDDAELRDLYRRLVLLRRVDAEAEAMQRTGELGLWAGCRGQEAAQVGAGYALRGNDHVFPGYRDHGLAFARGVDPLHVLSIFRGTDHGGWDPREHNVHPYTLVIAAQMLPAVGYAMGLQRDGSVGTGDPERDAAVVACFGDGATSQGEASEALSWASVYHAPVVFFCQNNQWAISEPVEKQSTVALHRRADGFGMPGVLVDGNDVLAVLAVVRAALERARRGEGPTFVEAYTFRMGAHTTSDDPSRYRSSAEVEEWRAKDPIERFETYLRGQDLLDEEFETALAAESEELAEHIRTGVRAMVDPDPAVMFDHAYAEPHAQVVEERDEFLAAWARHDAELAAEDHEQTAGGR